MVQRKLNGLNLALALSVGFCGAFIIILESGLLLQHPVTELSIKVMVASNFFLSAFATFAILAKAVIDRSTRIIATTYIGLAMLNQANTVIFFDATHGAEVGIVLSGLTGVVLMFALFLRGSV